MAQVSAPTSAERRAQAVAAAEAAAREAEGLNADESRKLADRLLKGGATARFDALADETSRITLADRRRLLSSLTGKAPSRRAITAGTASRWAIFRSRLPYRVQPLVLGGLAVAGGITALLVARSHTPEGIVASSYSQNLQVAFTLPNGTLALDPFEDNRPYGLDAGRSYALVRQENGEAVLRQWVPGIGYAEAHVPASYVHWVP